MSSTVGGAGNPDPIRTPAGGAEAPPPATGTPGMKEVEGGAPDTFVPGVTDTPAPTAAATPLSSDHASRARRAVQSVSEVSDAPNAELCACVDRLRENLKSVLINSDELIESLLIAAVTGGRLMIQGKVGKGKTTASSALAQSLPGKWGRIQGNDEPVLDRDILPVLKDCTCVIVDELNRMSPRDQSAMLQAFAENSVTVGGETIELRPNSVLIATQNDRRHAGTHDNVEPLWDRLLMVVQAQPLNREGKHALLETRGADQQKPQQLESVVTDEELTAIRTAVLKIGVTTDLREYMIHLTEYLDKGGICPADLRYEEGRSLIFLQDAARALAFIEGSPQVLPDHVSRVFERVIFGRIFTTRRSVDPDGSERRALARRVLDEVQFRPASAS